jgi:hypothetical protein
MNKGLFIHIIVSMIVFVAWLFLLWDEPVSIEFRISLIVLLGFFNLVAAAVSDMNNFYNQKIKL